MGKNKLQKFAEMEALPNVFQYPFGALQEAGFAMKGRWNELFFHRDKPIVLELGCGKGEYAVGLGRLFPDKNFIGIDIKGARMWSGAKEAHTTGLENVAFLRTHIELIEHFFAPGEVAEIWITFPDPQMKKRNKRLTSTRFMRMYRKILGADGVIHLKTDSPFLYAYTTAMVALNRYPVRIATDDLYQSGKATEILSIQTHYEQQWIERGLTIKYLQFVCEERPELLEPEEEFEPDPYRSYNRSRRSQSSPTSPQEEPTPYSLYTRGLLKTDPTK